MPVKLGLPFSICIYGPLVVFEYTAFFFVFVFIFVYSNIGRIENIDVFDSQFGPPFGETHGQ